MVRAILAGTKTQTRRVVKQQPPSEVTSAGVMAAPGQLHDGEWSWLSGDPKDCDTWGFIGDAFRCPYGQPGDRLWVRESGWERPARTPKMMREGADTWPRFAYAAGGYSDQDRDDFKAWGFKPRPSIHMPRWASRILLEIVGVRVERLQEISREDAIAEGLMRHDGAETWWGTGLDGDGFNGCRFISPVVAYRALWESINGPGSWSANPWVWVVEFKRVMP